jgi:hypothetical protein
MHRTWFDRSILPTLLDAACSLSQAGTQRLPSPLIVSAPRQQVLPS